MSGQHTSAAAHVARVIGIGDEPMEVVAVYEALPAVRARIVGLH